MMTEITDDQCWMSQSMEIFKSWIKNTNEVVASQSSIDPLNDSEVDTLIDRIKEVLALQLNLEQLSTMAETIAVLSSVAGNWSVTSRDAVVYLLRKLVAQFLSFHGEGASIQEVNEDVLLAVTQCCQVPELKFII